MPYPYANPIYLLQDINTDTTGESISLPQSGPRTVVVVGDLGGGNISIEISLDNVTFTPLTNDDYSTFTVTQATQFEIVWLNQGQYLRAVLTGSTGASGVTVAI